MTTRDAAVQTQERPGEPQTTRQSLRVVVLTTSGAGGAYGFLDGLLTSLGHRIVAALTTPGPLAIRSDDYLDVVAAAAPDVDVIVSTRRERWAPIIATFEPDLLICAAFPYRVPGDVLAVPRLGAINAHSSLLPRYRGPNPQGWVLRNGEPETGLTIHRMTAEFDDGPILSQVRIPVSDDDDIDALGRHLGPLLTGVFTVAIERVLRGEPGEAQDPEQASQAPFFPPSWRCIDWRNPARMIHNQVRSLFEMAGEPAGAVAEVNGRKVRILATHVVTEEPGMTESMPTTGTVLAESDTEFTVQCGDKPLQILSWSQA